LEDVLADLPKRQTMYRVVVERSAEKDLRRLPLDVRFRVANALRSLANDPRPVETPGEDPQYQQPSLEPNGRTFSRPAVVS